MSDTIRVDDSLERSSELVGAEKCRGLQKRKVSCEKEKGRGKKEKMTYYQNQVQRSQYSYRRNANLKYDFSTKKLGPVSTFVVAVLLLALIGIMYASQQTKASRYAYPISQLESTKKGLTQENERLQVELARQQSLEEVQKSQVSSNLTTPSSVDRLN